MTETSLKRYKYVGKERDEETGLYYYGARYYAAWLCRFVSVDPLQFKYPELTPYQYASNRPVTMIDIDGLEAAQPYITEPVSTYYSNAYIETGKRFEAAMAKKIENQKAVDEFNKKYGFVQQNLKNIPTKPVQPGFQGARKVTSNLSAGASTAQLVMFPIKNQYLMSSTGDFFRMSKDFRMDVSSNQLLQEGGIYRFRSQFITDKNHAIMTNQLSENFKSSSRLSLSLNIGSSVLEGANYFAENVDNDGLSMRVLKSIVYTGINIGINYNPASSVIYNFGQAVTNTDEFKTDMMNYYKGRMEEFKYDKQKLEESERLYYKYAGQLGIKFEKTETTIGPSNH